MFTSMKQDIERRSTGMDHLEKVLSFSGGLLSILGILYVSQAFLGLQSSAAVVASMGASAVLLFAVPHGHLSQPWPVLGGHLLSAFIGVTCALLIDSSLLAAALAVGLAIGAMHYCRCLHPPGGATALTAVLGGQSILSLGYLYLLTPVLLNVIVILTVAVIFNYPFAWRRYPVTWSALKDEGHTHTIKAEQIRQAAVALTSGQGLTEADMDNLYHLTCCNNDPRPLPIQSIRTGAYYGNGKFGADWQVRYVTKIDSKRPSRQHAQDRIEYRIVAGAKRRSKGDCTRAEFAQWAQYQVERNENSWQRVEMQN